MANVADHITVNMERRRIDRGIAVSNLKSRFKSIYDATKLPRREAVWEHAVQQIGVDAELTVLEFGVYSGRSMTFWARHFTNPAARFHGFDSFLGLPEEWSPGMKKGAFSRDGKTPDIADERVAFHTGWFQNTVKPFLDENHSSVNRTLLVHFDADLYSATLFLLGNLWQYFDNYYFIFDEFFNDENRALSDFMSAYPCEVSFYSYAANTERHPGQVFGFMKKIPFEIKD